VLARLCAEPPVGAGPLWVTNRVTTARRHGEPQRTSGDVRARLCAHPSDSKACSNSPEKRKVGGSIPPLPTSPTSQYAPSMIATGRFDDNAEYRLVSRMPGIKYSHSV
jgi:hypothetical protein